KRDVELIKNKIKQVVVDLGSFAKKDRVKVLEKYIEFIDPTRYVTIDQVEKIIKNILEENK
ncbi:hypothetical protein HQ529_05860, partial [Candidatus Woesearchaeota archaeon]|nr:hypothetical protein [Candidatus Woesearchaeota archaeon]